MIRKTLMILVLVGVVAAAARAGDGTKTAPRRIDIAITEDGFVPDKIDVKAGEAVSLAFTRKTDRTCITEVVLNVNDKDKVEKKLPLNQTITVDVKFDKAGQLGYACAMNMYKGVIAVR